MLKLAAQALSVFGQVDILINNAAIRPHQPFTELSVEDSEQVRGWCWTGPYT